MEHKKRKNNTVLKSIFLLIIVSGIFAYSYSFPKTMELLDKKASEIFNGKEITVFSDFSKLSNIIINDILYIIELIEINFNERDFDTSPLPVAIITNAAFFPAEVRTVTSDFGKREDPITGKIDNHSGIDIAAPVGSTIFSAWPGTVKETGFDDIYGKYVVVEHSDDFFTKYCHLSKISVNEGDFINASEKIGEAGSTGRSTGSHLHFEVMIDGQNINPSECFEA